MSGWIKLHRKIGDSGLMQNHHALALFIHLLLKATREEKSYPLPKGGVLRLKRGQWVTGRKVLARELGITERKVRTALSFLFGLEIIDVVATNEYSLITIVNYDKYQSQLDEATSKRPAKRPKDDQQNDQHFSGENPFLTIENEDDIDSGDQQNDQQMARKSTTKQEERSKMYTPSFERVWNLYPPHRRTGKARAFTKWKRLKCEQMTDRIINALNHQKETPGWKDKQGQFVPAINKWIDEERWNLEQPKQDESPF